MSVYFRQNANISNFSGSDSWTVLSPIEKQIKEKIETIGTPLKDWNIQINYGIKTGFNDAFIITGEKRKELIEQDPKSEEIIRPILRGRNIRRYIYDFDNQYLISTFPSLQVDIEQYPAVKSYLLSFGKELLVESGNAWIAENYLSEWCYKRLEQTGKEIFIDGQKISFANNTHARKKTNNKWFETQDAISYWDDFSKQKIVWKRVGSIIRFSYDQTGALALDSTCFATGKYIKYLVAILNSKFGHYLLRGAPKTGTGDLLISVQAIEPLVIPIPNQSILVTFERYVDLLCNPIIDKTAIEKSEKQINHVIYDIYNFSEEEITFIESL